MVLCSVAQIDTMLYTALANATPPGCQEHTCPSMMAICHDRHRVMRKLTKTVAPSPDSPVNDTDSDCSSDGRRKIKVSWRAWKITLTVCARELVSFCATRDSDGAAVWARPQDANHIVGSSSRQALDDFCRDSFDVMAYYYSHRYFKDVEPDFEGGNPCLV